MSTTDYSNSVSQTFSVPLCVPTQVDAAGTNQLTPTTIVSLCPIPLALSTHVMTPPPGDDAQLYLSVQRLAGSGYFPASFAATYTVPGISPPLTTTYTADSGSGNSYPDNAIVGAATDYNPVSSKNTDTLTMGWASDGWEARLSVGAQGIGDVSVEQVPTDSGSFTLTYNNGKFTAQLANATSWSGGGPAIVIHAVNPDAAGESATLSWSNLPQDFSYNLQATLASTGQPVAFSFDGTQSPSANFGFWSELDLLSNGVLSGKYLENGLGAQFSEGAQLTRDQVGNVTGVDLKSDPGTLSAIQLYDYQSGQLAALLELAGVNPSASEVAVNFQGGANSASAGVTFSGTTAPQFIGIDSYYTSLTGGAISASAQASVGMTQVGANPSLPTPISTGSQAAMTVAGLDPNFQMSLELPTTGDSHGSGGTGTYELSGSTPDAATAQHITVTGQMDPTHRDTLVMNALGQQWDFKVTPHGTSSTDLGADFSDTNTPANGREFKEIVVSGDATGSYQPEFTFVLQRSGSDNSNAIAPAGSVMKVSDPPATFDLDVHASTTNVNGNCTVEFDTAGTDATPATGSVSLTSATESVQILNEFVQGQWSVSGSGQGPSTSCAPDQGTFSVHQDLGANPGGQLIVATPAVGLGGGTAQLTLSGFATTTDVAVNISEASGSVTAFQVNGGNSEANPSEQIQLDVLNGAGIMDAVNISAGAVTAPGGTLITFDVANAPQDFGISGQHSPGAGTDSAVIGATNLSPQPNETITVTAPSALIAGDTVALAIKSLDTSSSVRFVLTGSTTAIQVDSYNANPNQAEVIAGALLNGGSPVETAVFSGSAGALGGIPQGGSAGALAWQPMPQTFSFFIRPTLTGSLSSSVASGDLSVQIGNAQADSASVLTLSVPAQNAHIVVSGTGSEQHFHIHFNRDDLAQSASVEVDGNLPQGFNNLQVYSLNSSPQDVELTVYRGGATQAPWSTNGTDFQIDPRAGQTAFGAAIQQSGRNSSVTSTADQTGERVTLAQYYQYVGGAYSYCSNNYPCTELSLSAMPLKADIAIESPTLTDDTGSMTYSGSDDGLRVTLQSLVPGIAGNFTDAGLPSGWNMSYRISPSQGIEFQAYAGGKSLNYFYMSGWNLNYSDTQTTTCTAPLIPGINITASVTANLHYTASLSLEGDAGLTWVKMMPAFVTCNEGAEYLGTEGVRVDGPSNAKLSLGLSLGLNPGLNSLGWSWSSFGTAPDSDSFSWNVTAPAADYGAGEASFYAWEALRNNTNKWVYGSDFLTNPGCTAVQQASTDQEQWFPSTIPFPTTFTQENNGVVLCGGRVGYYQLDPQGLAFEHCTDWGGFTSCPAGSNPSGKDRYSTGSFFAYTSDWMLADSIKHNFSADPDNLWSLSPGG